MAWTLVLKNGLSLEVMDCSRYPLFGAPVINTHTNINIFQIASKGIKSFVFSHFSFVPIYYFATQRHNIKDIFII
jgi:hypothetical protein